MINGSMSDIMIREIREEEIYKLEDMLYESIYQPDKQNLVPRSVLQIPAVYAYIDNFGKLEDDYCLVACSAEEIIGAVWVRILSEEVKGFGNVDSETPEFAISLLEGYRNRGIGTELMRRMIGYLKKRGYKQTSLSVSKGNYAVKLYRKVGFEIVEENSDDYIMLLELN